MTTKDDVLTALRDVRVQRLQFSVGSVRVRDALFREVYEAIDGDWLQIISPEAYERASGRRFGATVAALYLTDRDTMVVRPRPGGTIQRRDWDQTVIHEAFHAACDIHQMRRINRLSEEAIAYLAGMAYIRMAVGGDRPIYDATLSPIFGEAERLVMQHELAEWYTGHEIPALQRTDIQRLRETIHADPTYNHIDPAEEMPVNDGIWGSTWYSDRVLFAP